MSLRARVPFRASREDEDESHELLGEQEQEEIIQELRKETDQSNTLWLWMLRLLLALSILLQFIYLNSTTVPKFLAVFSIASHLNAAIFLFPQWLVASLKGVRPLPLKYVIAASVLTALFFVRDVSDLHKGLQVWENVLVLVFVFLGLSWINDSQTELDQLTAMQFPAKSA